MESRLILRYPIRCRINHTKGWSLERAIIRSGNARWKEDVDCGDLREPERLDALGVSLGSHGSVEFFVFSVTSFASNAPIAVASWWPTGQLCTEYEYSTRAAARCQCCGPLANPYTELVDCTILKAKVCAVGENLRASRFPINTVHNGNVQMVFEEITGKQIWLLFTLSWIYTSHVALSRIQTYRKLWSDLILQNGTGNRQDSTAWRHRGRKKKKLQYPCAFWTKGPKLTLT
jgi:hypothetical protein